MAHCAEILGKYKLKMAKMGKNSLKITQISSFSEKNSQKMVKFVYFCAIFVHFRLFQHKFSQNFGATRHFRVFT